MKGRDRGGRLPDGTQTRSDRRYVQEWRRFAAPLKAALGAEIHGFDPGVSYIVAGRVESFSNGVVWRLNEALASRLVPCRPEADGPDPEPLV